MKNKVLIVSYTGDNHCIETVSKAIKNNGGIPVRLDIDRYPVDFQLSSTYLNGKWEVILNDGDELHNLTNEFCGVWNRRFYHLGDCLKDELEEAFLRPSIGESNATLIGAVTHMERELFTMNSYAVNRQSSVKEDQLRMASEFGLTIPKTCITNDREQAINFVQQCDNGAIVKMQHGFSMQSEGKEAVVYTNEVSLDDLSALDNLRYCPMKFQEKVDKQVELRITVIGTEVYTYALKSQEHQKGKVDWRRVGFETLEDWEPFDLPEEVKHQLLLLHDHFKLNYGATDIIVTPEGKYVYLETNPGGEFFWLDRHTEYAMSDQIAKVLLGQAERRPHLLYENALDLA